MNSELQKNRRDLNLLLASICILLAGVVLLAYQLAVTV